MSLKRWLWRRDKNAPVLLRFEGGMGNQLLNAALYFHLRGQGRAVYADLNYFDQPEHVVEVGHKGEISHWPWQLDHFGLGRDRFEAYDPQRHAGAAPEFMPDDTAKLELVLQALTHAEVRQHFPVEGNIGRVLPGMADHGYLCIHIRRGDYVNVASHLVSDQQFIAQAEKFAALIDCVVVLSDSPIPEATRAALNARFSQAHFLDQTDAWTAHRIMRLARVLLCSNSQFSLIGAALNPHALVLLPMQWFDEGERAAEAALRQHSPFMVMG